MTTVAEDPATVVRAGPFLLWRLLHTVALGVGDILYPRLRECWMPVAVLVGMVGSWVWSVACFGLVNWHENFHKSLSVLCFPYWIWSILFDTKPSTCSSANPRTFSVMMYAGINETNHQARLMAFTKTKIKSTTAVHRLGNFANCDSSSDAHGVFMIWRT